ncbi:heme-binding protein [Streptomyces sp. NBC_01356]|uniref:GlcG/HbpS family heme-binding protein n=1 Tax=Streptomyces sp. NBC_01356 TaxID=2903836 RepID=UPI002E37369E|nr:heme-binding protein [Streptomyces sp. NBC_01356]
MSLTTEAADEILAACAARARAIDKATGIAVVDVNGFVLCARRSANTRPNTVEPASAKAYTAAVMGCPTQLLESWADSKPVLFMQLSQLGKYPIMATDGGVPVKRDGEVVGGLGFSGATGAEDQRICEEVLAALGYELDFVPPKPSLDAARPKFEQHA